jgi:hypothetical protein
MFGQILDLADKLDIIKTVKAKLLREPDPAADKLVAVLGELSKIYGACEAELRRYLSLSFDPAAGLAEERDVLLTLESGQLRLRASEARGHCHKIWNIYQRYLERWFHKVLAPDEASAMRNLFERLGYADSQMEVAIDELTNWLTREAQETLDQASPQSATATARSDFQGDERPFAAAGRFHRRVGDSVDPAARGTHRPFNDVRSYVGS